MFSGKNILVLIPAENTVLRPKILQHFIEFLRYIHIHAVPGIIKDDHPALRLCFLPHLYGAQFHWQIVFPTPDQQWICSGCRLLSVYHTVQRGQILKGSLWKPDIHSVELILRLLRIGGYFPVCPGKPFDGEQSFQHHQHLGCEIFFLHSGVKMIDIVAAEAGKGTYRVRIPVCKILCQDGSQRNADNMHFLYLFLFQDIVYPEGHFIDAVAPSGVC